MIVVINSNHVNCAVETFNFGKLFQIMFDEECCIVIKLIKLNNASLVIWFTIFIKQFFRCSLKG